MTGLAPPDGGEAVAVSTARDLLSSFWIPKKRESNKGEKGTSGGKIEIPPLDTPF